MKQMEEEKNLQVQQIKVRRPMGYLFIVLSQNEFEVHRAKLASQLHHQQQDNERMEQVCYHSNPVFIIVSIDAADNARYAY